MQLAVISGIYKFQEVGIVFPILMPFHCLEMVSQPLEFKPQSSTGIQWWMEECDNKLIKHNNTANPIIEDGGESQHVSRNMDSKRKTRERNVSLHLT